MVSIIGIYEWKIIFKNKCDVSETQGGTEKHEFHEWIPSYETLGQV